MSLLYQDVTENSEHTAWVESLEDRPGLSTCHISPQDLAVYSKRGAEKYKRRREDILGRGKRIASVTIWAEGSLVRIEREENPAGKGGKNKRGFVSGFSHKSRRRMMLLLARVRRADLPVFVTLTYPDEYIYSKDPARWSRDVDAFSKRLARSYPGVAAVWKKETKRRKSGKYIGAIYPHFHLLIWGIANLEAFREWVSRAWYEVAGTGEYKHFLAGTEVSKIKSQRGVMWYCSKYMSKNDYDWQERQGSSGRWWGVLNRQSIPWARAIPLSILAYQADLLMRYARRLMRYSGRSNVSLSLICNADFWFRRLDDIVMGGSLSPPGGVLRSGVFS